MIIKMGMGLLMLLFGGYVVYEASTYPDFSMLTPVDSDVFPSIMGWVIIICSIIMIAREAYKLFFDADKEKYRAKEQELFAELRTRFQENKRNLPAAIGIPTMMLLYAVLLNTVGFEILSVLFLFIGMLLCRERNPLRLILIPIIGTAVMYYVFRVLLKIMLPMAFL